MSEPGPRSLRSAVDGEARAVVAFLSLLVARERGGLLEVRARRPDGRMAQRFYPAGRLHEGADRLLELGARTDVYVGCAPRQRRAGDRTALGQVWVLWADCDDAGAVDCLASFSPAPAVIVRSGTGTNAHAYWPLLRPVAPDEAGVANHRLAAAIGACRSAVTCPTAILRVPGTRNFKHDPPRPVTLDVFRPWQRFTVEELVGRGPALDGNARRGGAVPAADPASGAAPLRRIPPAVYVHALTGQRVGRNRKISCPLHDDRTPSLHVYDDPERGWYCFGCGRGGSIYDLAAALYFSGQSPEVLLRGERFIEVRARLMAMFFPAGAG
jgi:CHC2 zinc finger